MENQPLFTSLDMYDYATIETENQTLSLDQSGTSVTAPDLLLKLEAVNDHQDILLTAIDTPVKYIKLRWNKAFPRESKILGDAWERGYGDLEWKGIAGSRFMPWYFLISLSKSQYGIGVMTNPSAMCYWQLDPKGVTLVLDVRCGTKGVLLNGRTLTAAQIVCKEYQENHSFIAAQKFCKLMCPNPIFPKAPVYGSNNWYYAYGDSSEEEILSDTDYLLMLTKEATNPPYMVIDDCWQENHRLNEYNGGPWTKGNKKFPDMKGLAKKISDKGAIPGIWVRFLANEDPVISDEWRLSINNCLDPSHPDALAYIREDVKRICEWGYRLIKHDFSTFDLFGRWGFEMTPFVTEGDWCFFDRSKTSAEIVKSLYQEIYNVCKAYDTIIIGCNTIGHLGTGLMQVNRTGDDTSGKNWERTRRMGINTLAFRLPQHRTFYDVDADCVGIAGNIPWKLNKQWADVLAESGTPLFLSIKPGILNDDQIKEMQKILKKASTQTCHKIPVDWELTDCPEIWTDEKETLEYDWYEEEGTTLASKQEKYYAYIPLS